MLLLSGWVTTIDIFSSGFLLTSASEMVQCSLMETWHCWRLGPDLETSPDGKSWFCSLSCFCFWGLVLSLECALSSYVFCMGEFKVLETIHLKKQKRRKAKQRKRPRTTLRSNLKLEDNGCVYHFALLWKTAGLNNLRGGRFYFGYCLEAPVVAGFLFSC